MRLVEVVCDPGYMDTVAGIAEHQQVLDYWTGGAPAQGRQVIRLLVRQSQSQAVVDALQSALGGSETARVVILDAAATLPRPDDAAEPGRRGAEFPGAGITREELYDQLERGAQTHVSHLFLVALSTVVAAIGLIADNVAVVIGAMVIAPLLGPNLALAFATSLGEGRLTGIALRTTLTGLLLAVALAWGIGWVWAPLPESGELAARTGVGLDGVALALASGAAAALSLTMGTGTALVGVMVAVALLPPAATLGLSLGAKDLAGAAGAGMLLIVNVVCVNLAAELTFLVRGTGPRTRLQRDKARRSLAYFIVFWLVSLLVLVGAIVLRGA